MTFEDLRWPVGIRLQCLVQRGPRGQIVGSTLIGYLVNEYLIIRTPLENGLPMQFEPGDSMRIRAFSGVYVSEFKTEVDRVFRSPWYLHLSYPTQVRVQKLRSAPRVKIDLPATVTTAGGTSAPGRLLDISVNGAQVVVGGLEVSKDQTLSLAFELDGGDGVGDSAPLQVRARVAAARGTSTDAAAPQSADPDGKQSLGLVFDGLDPADTLRISNFVYQKLLTGV
ncbi:MAG: flagellar brake protein [Burkholderiaceae bacterium]